MIKSICPLSRTIYPQYCEFENCYYYQSNENFFEYETLGNCIVCKNDEELKKVSKSWWKQKCTHPLNNGVYLYREGSYTK